MLHSLHAHEPLGQGRGAGRELLELNKALVVLVPSYVHCVFRGDLNYRPAVRFLMSFAFLCVLPGCIDDAKGPPVIGEDDEQERVAIASARLVPWDFGEPLFTGTQADWGVALFQQHCSMCHFPEDFTGSYFHYRWNDATVAYLYRFMSRQMPRDAPGRLRPEEYAAILAFFLRENGLPEGEVELPAEESALEEFRFQRRRSL